jgi:hypothetical protein
MSWTTVFAMIASHNGTKVAAAGFDMEKGYDTDVMQISLLTFSLSCVLFSSPLSPPSLNSLKYGTHKQAKQLVLSELHKMKLASSFLMTVIFYISLTQLWEMLVYPEKRR